MPALLHPAFTIEPHTQPVPVADRAARLVDPGFGRVFTDHMVSIKYREGEGWYDAKVMPRGPLLLVLGASLADGMLTVAQAFAVAALVVAVTRRRADSTLARIVHLVESAQAKRAPLQQFIDRFAAWYTPSVTQ